MVMKTEKKCPFKGNEEPSRNLDGSSSVHEGFPCRAYQILWLGLAGGRNKNGWGACDFST